MTILKPVLYLFNKNMAIRTALLTSKNINLDTDFSKYIETVSEPGVIEGLAVTASSVATGIAWVLCERTNGETIYSLVQNFNSVSISGDGYVIISIPQNIVDNGGGNEDGTGIASIEVVSELPEKNYLLLATISGGTVTDNRNMIKKVGELSTEIDSIFAQLEDLDQRVDKLEAADAIDHLEERALVGENYALTDTLFKQLTPKLADSTVEANVGDVAANTQVHIQRLGSGIASNELKLKLKSAGSPTTGLTVEVRKGVKVDVSDAEAYWYGDENNIIATGTIAYGDISNDWSEITVTLDNEFGGTEGELLDIVLYQTGSIVNASNYYIMACDSTQWSEGFSYVCVNGTTRTRQKLMPYCVSSGFAQAMLSKVDGSYIIVDGIELYSGSFNAEKTINRNTTDWETIYTVKDGTTKLNGIVYGFVNSSEPAILFRILDGTTEVYNVTVADTASQYEQTITFNNKAVNSGALVQIGYKNKNGTYQRTSLYKRNVSLTGNSGVLKGSKYKGLPRSSTIKNIGYKESATLFGVHTDNTRITQDAE